MNKKLLNQALICFLLYCFISLPSVLRASEVDGGIVIVDRKPWKISWVQENNHWVLIANFDKGTLRTYFKNQPPAKGFGLSINNKPIKQEFEFYFGKKFTSINCQYEQWALITLQRELSVTIDGLSHRL